ncbi:MAG TPA: hypothetical protein VKU02_13480 [Gemmataceae bacterium]|nr:hypothetical protein [Gemmataceae bacterium]
MAMQLRILDLDGSLAQQTGWVERYQPSISAARDWGPAIRLACSFKRFRRFEQKLATLLPAANGQAPALTFYGSGDFHHVSLALVRRLTVPVNLLVFDNHPDWMRGVPLLHCGTWLYHAACLPMVHRIFHVGGDVDFDNFYRWMAPWQMLRSGKIVVFPGRRRFLRGAWSAVSNEPVRPEEGTPIRSGRAEELLDRYRTELARRPLYISLDKDVLVEQESVVNWDSGHLTLAEVNTILHAFLAAANANLAGIDVTGDWSTVQVHGALRQVLHTTEHPAHVIDPNRARLRNQQTNIELVDMVQAALAASRSRPVMVA